MRAPLPSSSTSTLDFSLDHRLKSHNTDRDYFSYPLHLLQYLQLAPISTTAMQAQPESQTEAESKDRFFTYFRHEVTGTPSHSLHLPFLANAIKSAPRANGPPPHPRPGQRRAQRRRRPLPRRHRPPLARSQRRIELHPRVRPADIQRGRSNYLDLGHTCFSSVRN